MIQSNIYKNEFMDTFDKNGNPIFSHDMCTIDGTTDMLFYQGNGKGKMIRQGNPIIDITPDRLVNIMYNTHPNALEKETIYAIMYFDIRDNTLVAIPRVDKNWEQIYHYYENFPPEDNLTVSGECGIISDYMYQKLYKVHIWKVLD